jgi:hypothetical protein
MEEPAPQIVTRAPSESEVSLPGGYVNPKGELVKTAEVRELTGSDEEAIAKAGDTGKALNVLLQRGLVKLGSEDVTKTDLDNLLSGDRDAILLGIRRVTFGETLKVPVACQHCGDEHAVEIHLLNDVPVRELENSDDRTWAVDTKQGVAVITLPTGIVQKRLMENLDKTVPEINTILLSGCLLSLNGVPSMGSMTALSLSMNDRSKLVEEIVSRTPGPRLGEVKKACKACGEDMQLPLSLVDLFRL